MNEKPAPVIGVTRCSKLEDYVAAVEQTGARARVLEVTESPRKVLSEIDGLLLTGGGDVDPAFYGQARHPEVQDAEPGRDEFEIDIARRAMDADLPLFAICRGSQVLNVAAGGTLVQDIPSQVADGLAHTVPTPKDAVAHDVQVREGSTLERALGGRTTTSVNSRHHQSVGTLGGALVATATAPDGIIEAIEAPGKRFCLGVQWHPENFWRSGEFASLFDAFVAAAKLTRAGDDDE